MYIGILGEGSVSMAMHTQPSYVCGCGYNTIAEWAYEATSCDQSANRKAELVDLALQGRPTYHTR